MDSLNQDIVDLVEKGNTERAQELKEQVKSIKESLRDARKVRAVKDAEAVPPDGDYSVTKLWGDPRQNPYWLKLAEYFAIKEKEYPNASSKLNVILDWAANKSKSRKMGDILGTVGGALKKLQSPGYSERAYAVLYRYIKLEDEKASASPEIKKEIEKEMTAYTK